MAAPGKTIDDVCGPAILCGSHATVEDSSDQMPIDAESCFDPSWHCQTGMASCFDPLLSFVTGRFAAVWLKRRTFSKRHVASSGID
jgi:hypothetical protein